MHITFLGTRGYIDITTTAHRRHTATLLTNNNKRVMIDCGLDWRTKIWKLNPDAIVITHAHPDHAWGLQDGSPCPVYATRESWALMNKYPIEPRQRFVLQPRMPVYIAGLLFETFSVIHSIRAPGVGYRISAGGKSIFCVHDLISIQERTAALAGISLYIGDGASLLRPLVRRRGNQLFGHTTIRAQLGWCQQEHVPRAIFTHCGSFIVRGDGRSIAARVRLLGKERGVQASVAYDGKSIEL